LAFVFQYYKTRYRISSRLEIFGEMSWWYMVHAKTLQDIISQ